MCGKSLNVNVRAQTLEGTTDCEVGKTARHGHERTVSDLPLTQRGTTSYRSCHNFQVQEWAWKRAEGVHERSLHNDESQDEPQAAHRLSEL